MPIEIHNTDYTHYIQFLGTAHFTQRSVQEASHTVKNTGIKDLALELDLQRFHILDKLCIQCTQRMACTSKCEFVAASDALGNIDANIWLIDMSEKEMMKRLRMPIDNQIDRRRYMFRDELREENLPWLWEHGFKDEVLQRSNQRLERLRRSIPPLWRVLIKERNALMAARLTAIASNLLDKKEHPKILALVGAAHVKGIEAHLQNPTSIKETLKQLSLQYTPPATIQRIQVQNTDQKQLLKHNITP